MWIGFTIAKRGKKQVTILGIGFPLLGWFPVFFIPIRVWMKTSSSSWVNGMMVCIALPRMGNQVKCLRTKNNIEYPLSLFLLPLLSIFVLTNFFSLFPWQKNFTLLQIATWWTSKILIGFYNLRSFFIETGNFRRFMWSLGLTPSPHASNLLNTWLRPKIQGLH